MAQNSPVDGLLADFFQAVNLRDLARSHAILAELDTLATEQAGVQPWSDYCRGILAFEEDRDWAAAERIFNGMLQSELSSSMRCRVLYALGRTYIVQGRWQAAIDIYARLAVAAETAGQPLEVVKAQRQIAVCYCKGYANGDFDASVLQLGVTHCQAALDSLSLLAENEQPSPQLTWLAGSVWGTLGILYSYLEQWDKALECFQQDLACCRRLDDRHGIGLTHNNLGEVYHGLGNSARGRALFHYLQALKLVREFGNAYEELDVLRNLGRLHDDLGEYGQAQAYYQQAITLIERLRTNVSSDEGRAGFFSTVVDAYARMVDILLKREEIGLAFDMTERARSRTFIELLANHPVRPSPEIPPPLIVNERRLRDRLQHAYASSADEARFESARIVEMEEELAEIQRQIRLLDSAYSDLHVVEPLTHAQVQERLPPTTALLAYYDTGEALSVFVITRDALTMHPLSLTATQLQRAFDDQGRLVRLTPGKDGRLHEPWLLDTLYTQLVAPIAGQLQGKDRLVILPWGPLHFVPFAALVTGGRDGERRTLLDEFEILYAPSATVLLAHCQRKRSCSSASILALGYNAADLHYAQAEASTIARLVDGAALLDQDATQEALLTRAAAARWLHLSCHGRFNTHAPLTSHLLLADGPFYAADILRTLRLNAELVTLSACETGRSQVLRGEELIGLVRAFLYAGTPSVLVTLWPVDEVSTIILMLRFYANMLNGHSKAAALRNAQRYLKELSGTEAAAILDGLKVQNSGESTGQMPGQSGDQQIFSHPYYWAPFVLMGDQISRDV